MAKITAFLKNSDRILDLSLLFGILSAVYLLQSLLGYPPFTSYAFAAFSLALAVGINVFWFYPNRRPQEFVEVLQRYLWLFSTSALYFAVLMFLLSNSH